MHAAKRRHEASSVNFVDGVDTLPFLSPGHMSSMRPTQPSMNSMRVYMTKFTRGLRMGVMAAGVAALASCAGMSADDKAALDQAKADAAAAQAAADRASQAADRAAAAAQQAADAAAASQMAAEKSDRAMAQGLRK
jgi:hypothetical protein